MLLFCSIRTKKEYFTLKCLSISSGYSTRLLYVVVVTDFGLTKHKKWSRVQYNKLCFSFGWTQGSYFEKF